MTPVTFKPFIGRSPLKFREIGSNLLPSVRCFLFQQGLTVLVRPRFLHRMTSEVWSKSCPDPAGIHCLSCIKTSSDLVLLLWLVSSLLQHVFSWKLSVCAWHLSFFHLRSGKAKYNFFFFEEYLLLFHQCLPFVNKWSLLGFKGIIVALKLYSPFLLRKGVFAVEVLVLFSKIHLLCGSCTSGQEWLFSLQELRCHFQTLFFIDISGCGSSHSWDGHLSLQPQTRSGTNQVTLFKTAVWLCQKSNLVIHLGLF